MASYLENGGNGADAYRKAGYKAKEGNSIYVNSSRKLRQPRVQALIGRINAMNQLKQEDIANGIIQEIHVADHSRDRLKGYELLGKAKGMFTDKIQHELVGGAVFAWKGELEDEGLQKQSEPVIDVKPE